MKLNTLHVDTEHTWRGGEQQALHLATGLRERGHEATVACQPGSPMAQRSRAAGLAVVEVRMRGEADFLAVLALRKLIRRGQFGIVHMHTSHAHTLGCAAVALGRQGKAIVSRRVDFGVAANPISGFKYRHGVDRFIAISQAVKRVLVEGGVSPERVAVVHSGIDLARFEDLPASRFREQFGLPPEAPVIGNVAAMADHKGQRYLLAAMPRVLEAEPGARLFVVGDGELRGALEAQARELDIEHAVTFTGFRTDVPQWLDFFDVFVMSSHLEGLCTSVLDALAMRKPVVATTAGGLPEIVDHEKTGLLVPSKAPRPLAEAIVRLVRDRELARRLGEAGRRRVEEAFSADAMVEGTLRVYREVTDESEDPAGGP
ncbi:MAG: glycosyltransferase family 4 protein [Candidatus Brocadiia bacterium]